MRAAEGYTSFPNDERRNTLQAYLEIPTIVYALGLPKGQRVLEVGCGRGNAFDAFIKHLDPSQLVGLDIDPQLIQIAKEQTNDLRIYVVQGDVREMPFPDGSFDIVFDFGTAYHINHPEHAMKEVSRVLVPGGLFVTESRINQQLAHPDRASGKRLPWEVVPELVLSGHAGLWSASIKAE